MNKVSLIYNMRIFEMARWKLLLLQLGITELVSIALFGLLGFWLAGVIAPVWILALPAMIPFSEGDPKIRQLLIPMFISIVLAMVVVASALGHWFRIFGHLALFLLNMMSALLLLSID